MPGQSKTLVQDTAQATGLIVGLPWHTALLKARLSSAGGSATVVVYGYVGADDSAPSTIATFTLSGANDHAEWLIDGEPWSHLRADITAIAGGATATCSMGY
jgi:hypothetical protein